MATRCASSCPSATSGRAPSGSAACSSFLPTGPVSGSGTATTTTPIPGRKSASASSARPRRARRRSLGQARCRDADSTQDVLDHLRLGVGVVLRVLPGAPGEILLGALVQQTVGLVGTEVIAKAQHARDLITADAEDMQVDIGIRAFEDAVFVPV